MRAVSLFSGCGGLDLGLERAGIEHASMCEIDPHARTVLRHHWPHTPLHDDVTTFDPERHHDGRPVDLVHGGSPCQDLSVAGRRAGLDGARSGLFWHQCRIADHLAAPWVLWENVPGALSSNGGADFAAVLWGITGLLPDVPDGGWRSMGFVVGPKRWAVWRVLDARWFGVAQRRRRVFVVGGPLGNCRPEVLLEPESSRRDSVPDAAAGAGTAAGVGGRSDKHRRDEFVGPLTAMDGWERPDNAHAEAGWLVPVVSPAVTSKWAKGSGGPAGDECQNLVVAFSENQQGEIVLTDHAHQLSTGGGKPGQGYPAVLSWQGGSQQDWIGGPGDIAPTLAHSSNSHAGHHEPKVLLPAYGFSAGNSAAARSVAVTEEGTPPLRAGASGTNQVPTVVDGFAAVRRLAPLECERLMGWPDGWTATGVTEDGRAVDIADSHRYRMCGNGVVANVAEWIGRRIVAVAS